MVGRESGIGLACAGGVVEGAFWEVGVLCALEEAVAGLRLERLDVYVGVSAGAIMTSCLANGIPPHVIRRAVLRQDAPDLNLRPEVLFQPAFGEFGRRALQIPGATVRALARHFLRPGDISLFGAFTELGRGLPIGLFDNAPLERYLRHVFSTYGRTNDFRELPTRLRVLAVDLNTSELKVFGDPGATEVPISRAVQASSALPVVYCPVEIDGAYYIDGVARRTLNASEALEEGAGLLFCINPIVPVDLGVPGDEVVCRHPNLAELGLPAVLSQMFRTMIHSRMRTGFRNYEFIYPDADVVLIEPEVSDHSLFFSNVFSFSNRYRVVRHAHEATLRYLLRHAGRLDPILRRHGLSLRWDVLSGGPPPFPPAREPPAPGGSLRETMERGRASLRRLDDMLQDLDGVGAGTADGDAGGGA
jgi:NTE family protein